MCIAAHGTDRLPYSYTFSFCFLQSRWYIKVSGRTKPAFTLSSNLSMQSLSPKQSINFPRESLFSGGHSSFWSHQSIYLLNIFSCEGQDFLHWRAWTQALIFVFLHMRDQLVFVLRNSTNYFIFLTVFLHYSLFVFLPYWLRFEKILTCIEMGNSSKCYWKSFREEFYVQLTS